MKKVSKGQLEVEERKITDFYKVLSKQPNEAAYAQILLYIFLFVSLIIAFVPAQMFMDEGDSVGSVANSVSILFCIASWTYMSKYRFVSNQHINENVVEKLIYMPINHKVYKNYMLKVLVKYLTKVTAVALVIQLAVTLIAFREVTIHNVLYIVEPVFLIPFVVNGIPIVTHDSIRR